MSDDPGTDSARGDHHQNLEEELFAVAVDTDETGRVKVTVDDVQKAGTKSIKVTGILPSGKKFAERMDYPQAERDQYKFVRLCRQAGYSLSSVDHLTAEKVEAEMDDEGDWQFYAPLKTPWTDRVRKVTTLSLWISAIPILITFAPISTCIAMWLDHTEADEEDDWNGWDRLKFWGIITLLWLAILVGASMPFGGSY